MFSSAAQPIRQVRLWRATWVLCVTCTAAGLLSACGAGHTKATPVAKVQWHACKPGQCGTLRVPLSYSDPNGEQISVALFPLPAKDPSRRIGTLLLNPGGPGESGRELRPARDDRFLRRDQGPV